MPKRRFKLLAWARQTLFPAGRRLGMNAILYLNDKRRENNPAFNPPQPLERFSQIYETTEMSHYG